MSYRIDSPYQWPIVIPGASVDADGVMSAADKTKLDAIGELQVYNFVGRNGAGTITVDGLPVGARLVLALAVNVGNTVQVFGENHNLNGSANFASSATVLGQLTQTSADNLSGLFFTAMFALL